MATTKRRRRTRKPRPEDRIDNLVFKIESVKRRWSRGPRFSVAERDPKELESSDHLEIAAVSAKPNELEIERLQLTIYSRDREATDDREFLGLCDRMRGDRGLLTSYLWLPLAEAMALGPALLERQFVELELRIRGFFRSKGRVQSIEFHTQMTAYEDWVVEAQEQGWPGESIVGPTGELEIQRSCR